MLARRVQEPARASHKVRVEEGEYCMSKTWGVLYVEERGRTVCRTCEGVLPVNDEVGHCISKRGSTAVQREGVLHVEEDGEYCMSKMRGITVYQRGGVVHVA